MLSADSNLLETAFGVLNEVYFDGSLPKRSLLSRVVPNATATLRYIRYGRMTKLVTMRSILVLNICLGQLKTYWQPCCTK